jgi:glutamate-ammonia-ligase adenylyltransferase
VTVPDTAAAAGPLLDAWGLEDFGRGFRNLQGLAAHLGPALRPLLPHLARFLPDTPDPDLALNALDRFFANPLAVSLVPTLLTDDARQFGVVLQLFGTSQFFGDVLAADPDFLETATAPLRVTPTPAELIEGLDAEVAEADPAGVLRVFRRYRRRQLLRIGVNDVIRDRPLEEVTADLSRVADAALAVAWEAALRATTQKFGTPRTAAGQPARAAVLAFGKLGGSELNYSSDIDLMLVYDV